MTFALAHFPWSTCLSDVSVCTRVRVCVLLKDARLQVWCSYSRYVGRTLFPEVLGD